MTSDLLDIMVPRCGYCHHPIANHQGDEGCTSIRAWADDSDPLPCACGAMEKPAPVPMNGICRICQGLCEPSTNLCDLCAAFVVAPHVAQTGRLPW